MLNSNFNPCIISLERKDYIVKLPALIRYLVNADVLLNILSYQNPKCWEVRRKNNSIRLVKNFVSIFILDSNFVHYKIHLQSDYIIEWLTAAIDLQDNADVVLNIWWSPNLKLGEVTRKKETIWFVRNSIPNRKLILIIVPNLKSPALCNIIRMRQLYCKIDYFNQLYM